MEIKDGKVYSIFRIYKVKPKNFNTQISFLETLLIGASIDKNSKLLNIQKTKFLKEMVVPGFFNSPKRRKSNNEKNFASMIR